MATTQLIRATMPLPKLTRASTAAQESVYDFGSLTVGECFLLADVVDVKKAKSKLQSAVGAWRARTGNKQTVLAVRSFIDAEGKDAVGIWRLEDKAVAE